MAAISIRLVTSLLLVQCASAGMSAILLRAVGHAEESLHSGQDPTSETIQTLDANHDGQVDQKELEAFAQKEGLDSTSATDDFSGLDVNGDGVLDPSELLQVLGGGAPNVSNVTASSKKNATLQPKQPVKPVKPPIKPPLAVAVRSASVQEHPHTVKGIAAEKPAAVSTAKHESRISIQDRRSGHVLDAASTARTPEPTKKQQPRHTPKPAQRSETVKPAPVERMVKHFAQVLRTAEILPVHDETLKLAKNIARRHASDSESADTQRVTVQSAAREVAEQLFIAESSQAKARVLDRKAAEQRANATVLAKLTTQEALNAAAEAAHNKANELLAKISKLEDAAERAQVRSAALHSKAKLETEEASELMAIADRALNHASPQLL